MSEQERIEWLQKAPGQEVASRIVEVQIRSVYGNNLVYPINENAKIFARMLGVKTFNKSQVHGMRDLGYTVRHVVQEVVI